MLTNLPVHYDLWISISISCLLTVGWCNVCEVKCLNIVFNVKALVDVFYQDKALAGAFSMFVKTDGSFAALVMIPAWLTAGRGCWALIIRHLSTGPARGTPGSRPGWQSVGSCRVAAPNTQLNQFTDGHKDTHGRADPNSHSLPPSLCCNCSCICPKLRNITMEIFSLLLE